MPLRITREPGENNDSAAIIIPQKPKLTRKKHAAALKNIIFERGAKAAPTTKQAQARLRIRESPDGSGGSSITKEHIPPAAAPSRSRLSRQERDRNFFTESNII